jgi:hypothetical protein
MGVEADADTCRAGRLLYANTEGAHSPRGGRANMPAEVNGLRPAIVTGNVLCREHGRHEGGANQQCRFRGYEVAQKGMLL